MELLKIIQRNKDNCGYLELGVIVEEYKRAFSSPTEMINELSLDIAKAYSREEVSYNLADDLMNQIWAYMLEDPFLTATNNFIPSPAYDIYDAFDSGEWRRKKDDSGIDPVKKYTDPTINKIIEKYT